jgi:hypothetical protein
MEVLTMADCMNFPKDWAKFLEDYSFIDHKEFYTNGARLIPVFRVEQMMHHYLRKATEGAVPVVRCKDCVHWYEREGVCLKIYSDGAVSQYAWQERKEDDFCSYGERREYNG